MDPIDETIEALILSGAVEIVALDSKTGEPLYSFGPKMKEIMPELYEEHLKEVNRGIMELWEKGYLDINFMDNDPLVSITEKALNPQKIEELPIELQAGLSEIKRLLVK